MGVATGMQAAVFDLDGTLTRQDMFRAFLRAALRAHGPGRPWRVAGLPLLAARLAAGGAGRGEVKAALCAVVLGGRSRVTLERLAEDFSATALATQVKPAALAAIAAHRARGDVLLLASASLDLYVAPIARGLGFHGFVATRLAWTAEGRVDGRLDGPNLKGAAKLAAVHAWLVARGPGLPPPIIAYSDHESDAPLLEAARRAVAVDPTPALARLAAARGWPVERWQDEAAAPAGRAA